MNIHLKKAIMALFTKRYIPETPQDTLYRTEDGQIYTTEGVTPQNYEIE